MLTDMSTLIDSAPRLCRALAPHLRDHLRDVPGLRARRSLGARRRVHWVKMVTNCAEVECVPAYGF